MKYQKIAECPQVLKELIEITNLVPIGEQNLLIEASSLITLLGGIEPDFTKGLPPTWEEIQKYDKAQLDAIKQIRYDAEKFPKFYEFMFGEFKYQNPTVENFFCPQVLLPYPYIDETLGKYTEVLRLNDLLRSVAWDCQRYVKKKIPATFTGNHFLSQRNSRKGFLPRLSFKDGKTNFQDDLFINALQNIDAKRLRVCPICKDVFWAKRIEAGTCQKRKCSNNFHQRQLRIREYEKRLIKLEKHQSNLSPENNLIKEKIDKLVEKIKVEKMKNGTL